MPDPFLIAHSCGILQFSCSGEITPVSIRDQMLRGKLFVDRAAQSGLISSTRPLLIVGAGAAGISAAIRASQHGIGVLVLEAGPTTFTRQKSCATRWLNPTQYDWPLDHFQQSRFPWTLPAMPLPWREQYSNLLAAIWDRQFRVSRNRATTQLNIEYQAVFSGVTFVRTSNTLTVAYSVTGTPKQFHCGAALYTIGFGTERASLGSFRSFLFWDSDPYALPNFGHPKPQEPIRVLVAGGGDGALQDFLRIATGQRSALDILRRLTIPHPVQHRLQCAEDQAQRAAVWNQPPHDHAVFSRLHNHYVQDVVSLAGNLSIQTQIRTLLSHSQNYQIDLAHSCNHFSRCYGLNRFLSMLVLECARRLQLPIRLRDQTTVQSIQGLGHICNHSASACLLKKHEVVLQRAPHCGMGNAQNLAGKFVYDVVVLRMGVQTPPLPPGTSLLRNPRQVLPYHAAE